MTKSDPGRVHMTKSDGVGPTVQRRLLGAQLRQLRERSGLTRAQAAKEIRCSEPKISRLELGRTGFKDADLIALLALYGVRDDDTRRAILALARDANAPGWWNSYNDVLPTWFERYVGLEAAASLIRTYEAQFIPGLLQTEDYTRAVTRDGQLVTPRNGLEDEIERRVALRASRQQALANSGTQLWAVIDEGALRRPIGGRPIMRAQLEHLLELRHDPSIKIQVMPFTFGGHAAEVGAFSLLRFAQQDLPDVIYLEHLTGALYLENPGDVDRYVEVFLRLAIDSTPPADSAQALAAIMTDT